MSAATKEATLKAELAERAEKEGLLDVAYATADSPFGRLLLAGTERGVVRVGLPGQDPDRLLEDLAARVSPRVLEAPGRLDRARRELDLYFSGRLRDFDLPLDWRLSSAFRRRALRQVARIPYGETRSYTEIAAGAGNGRAVRAAGTACGSNPLPILVPCHRVLRSGGALGGYGGGLPMKEALLTMEGVLP
jgi:methylated-DNA-[protein]-cysteine S-methyltransferase